MVVILIETTNTASPFPDAHVSVERGFRLSHPRVRRVEDAV